MRLQHYLPFVCTLALASASLAHAAVPERYKITELNTLAGTYSYASGINDLGQVAGSVSAWSASEGRGPNRAAVFSAGGVTELGFLPGDNRSSASNINNAGAVVGSSDIIPPGPGYYSQRAFVHHGTMSDFGTSAYFYTSPNDINEAGQIAGGYFDTGAGFPSQYRAFVYADGKMNDLGTLGGKHSYADAINDKGTAVGSSTLADDSTYRAFVYEDGVMKQLGTLGGPGSSAFDINNHGQIVGYSNPAGSGRHHAFLYDDGVMTDIGEIGFLAQTMSYAIAINDGGDVLGYAQRSLSPWGRAYFLYSDGQVYDLETLLDPAGGWTIEDVVGINDAGQIAINAYKQGVGYQALRLDPVSVVPEPAHWSMLLAGLGVLGVAARRR